LYTALDSNAWVYENRRAQGWTIARVMRTFLLLILVLVMYSTLVKTPYFAIYFPIGITFLFVNIFFTALLISDRLTKGGKFTHFEFLILGYVVFFPLLAATSSWYYFGQPFLLGLSAQKHWLTALLSLLTFYLLRARYITLYELRDALLIYPFITLPVFLFIIATGNPDKFQGSLFVYCNSVKGGCQFEFEIFNLIFASIYFFIRGMRENKPRYFILWLLFFSYVFFINQKRGTTLALLGTYGLFYLLNLSLNKKVFYAFTFVFTLIVGIIVLNIFRPDIVQRNVEMYNNIVQVIIGEDSGEASADARIRSTLIAVKYFNLNELSVFFGNGRINPDWKNGPRAEFGHFYPSDIGILGVIFSYGILGLIIGEIGYILCFFWNRRVKIFQDDPFYISLKYFIIFFIARGIPTGGNFFDPGISIAYFFIGLLFFYYYVERHPHRQYSL
jgi:hypothetical protein